jgi:hypothetical protein
MKVGGAVAVVEVVAVDAEVVGALVAEVETEAMVGNRPSVDLHRV